MRFYKIFTLHGCPSKVFARRGASPKQSFRPPFSSGAAPAGTRARWAGRCGGAVARGASPKQSFRPPFSKGGGFQRQRLWPPSADGGTLYPLGVFGGLGAFTRERPPRPLPIPLSLSGKRPPRWGGGPAGARGGPSYLFAACGRPAGSPSSFFLLEFSGILPEGLSGPAPTGGLLSCAGKKVTKETAGGLCRPPGPQALSFQTCSRSVPSI